MSLKSKKKDKNKDRMKKKRDKKDDSIKKKEKKEVKEKDDSKDKSDMDELFQNSVMKEYYDLVETHYPSLSKMMPTKIIPHHSKTPSDLDLSKAQNLLGFEPRYDIITMIDDALRFRDGEDIGVLPT